MSREVLSTAPADPPPADFEWNKYPLSRTGNPFWAGSAFAERPVPKHRPDASQIALMERLGLDPRYPNFEKLRGKLLAKGLQSDELRKLSVDVILAALEDDAPASPKPDENPTVKAALAIIRAEKGCGLSGKEIVKRMVEMGIEITLGTFRRHIVRQLKLHGIKNQRARGGYYDSTCLPST